MLESSRHLNSGSLASEPMCFTIMSLYTEKQKEGGNNYNACLIRTASFVLSTLLSVLDEITKVRNSMK